MKCKLRLLRELEFSPIGLSDFPKRTHTTHDDEDGFKSTTQNSSMEFLFASSIITIISSITLFQNFKFKIDVSSMAMLQSEWITENMLHRNSRHYSTSLASAISSFDSSSPQHHRIVVSAVWFLLVTIVRKSLTGRDENRSQSITFRCCETIPTDSPRWKEEPATRIA